MKEAARQVGHAFAQALLVDVEALACLRRDGLGHGNGLQQAEDGHAKSIAGECAEMIAAQKRRVKARQGGRDVADNLDSPLFQTQAPHQGGHGSHGNQVLRDREAGALLPEPAVEFADGDDQKNGAGADGNRRGMPGLAGGHGQPEAFEKVIIRLAHGGKADQVLELIEHQQNPRAQGKADDHGMRSAIAVIIGCIASTIACITFYP